MLGYVKINVAMCQLTDLHEAETQAQVLPASKPGYPVGPESQFMGTHPGAHVPSQCESCVGAAELSVAIQVADVDLDASMILGCDQLVRPGAALPTPTYACSTPPHTLYTLNYFRTLFTVNKNTCNDWSQKILCGA